MNANFIKTFYDSLQIIFSTLLFIGAIIMFIYHGILHYNNIATSLLFLVLLVVGARLFFSSVKDFRNDAK